MICLPHTHAHAHAHAHAHFTHALRAHPEKVSQSLLMAQIMGITRRKNSINGKPTSLQDLGYSSIGLDDGWQACGTGVRLQANLICISRHIVPVSNP